MFIIGLCFNFYCEGRKRNFKYPSYEETYNCIDNPKPYHPQITNSNLKSNNSSLSALEILESNYKQFAVLFIICLCVGFYCGNLLLQVQMQH
nr:MAG TPA_asm: hypothetical protein [Caudoviricetes sp.]